jgi:hypothetical protein
MVALVTGVAIAARDDWRAAAFLFERKYPQHWGRLSERRLDDELLDFDD